MGRDRRRELISAIEEKRNSRVIAYITSDRTNQAAAIAGDAVPLLIEHLRAQSLGDRDIDLFLYSRGGHSSTPWNMVTKVREFAGANKFGVLIPYRAHSAATMIAIGADEIVMTKMGELGPIDTTMHGPYNETAPTGQPLPVSVEDVMGYFALLNRVVDGDVSRKMQAFLGLNEKVHPLALGNVNRILQQTELVAGKLMATRREHLDSEISSKIARQLASEIFDHNHAIGRTEAYHEIGITYIKNAEEVGIDEEMWSLYEEYRDFFALDDPFDPNSHLIQNDLEEYVWTDMPLACMESSDRLDVFVHDVQVRRIRNIPPQVNLNFQNIGLPPVNLPKLLEGLPAEKLEQLIAGVVSAQAQTAITSAANMAARQFLKSLPTKGFESSALNAKWRKEEE